ncbi:MAG: hypothetical protein KTR35_18205, partial [Gammaproteobacteria bacterium]|nr:hypothetical protein [Gammaproteobacteria bacterium]
LEGDLRVQVDLLEGQLWAIQGNRAKAEDILNRASERVDEGADIDLHLAMVNTLMACGQHKLAQEKLALLIEAFKDNQPILEKIDPLLSEPVSDKGKKELAHVNKQGIAAYKAEDYTKAIDYFIRVEKRFPHYLGVKLNLVQALLGKMRHQAIGEGDIDRCLAIFDGVKQSVQPDTDQYQRYQQLRDMFDRIKAKQSTS